MRGFFLTKFRAALFRLSVACAAYGGGLPQILWNGQPKFFHFCLFNGEKKEFFFFAHPAWEGEKSAFFILRVAMKFCVLFFMGVRQKFSLCANGA